MPQEHAFIYRGVEVQGVRVSMWGGRSLAAATGLLAFATGRIEGRLMCFYKKKIGSVEGVVIPNPQDYGTVTHKGKNVSYVNVLDMSPVDTTNMTTVPSMIGNLYGDPSSLANYGSWFATRGYSQGLFQDELYEMHNSSIPRWAQRRLPEYPFWPSQVKPVCMGDALTYVLNGPHIRRIKLIKGFKRQQRVDATAIGTPKLYESELLLSDDDFLRY
jgi:hypothetical protein